MECGADRATNVDVSCDAGFIIFFKIHCHRNAYLLGSNPERWFVDYTHDGLGQLIGGNRFQIKDDCITVDLGFGRIRIMIAENWHRNYRNTMVDGFIHTKEATVGDKGAKFSVSFLLEN